jgi:hypothetical protein
MLPGETTPTGESDMREFFEEIKIPLIASGIFLVLMSLFVVWYSHEEAKAYNRVTGANVSTWDAMFLELRVQEGAK